MKGFLSFFAILLLLGSCSGYKVPVPEGFASVPGSAGDPGEPLRQGSGRRPPGYAPAGRGQTSPRIDQGDRLASNHSSRSRTAGGGRGRGRGRAPGRHRGAG